MGFLPQHIFSVFFAIYFILDSLLLFFKFTGLSFAVSHLLLRPCSEFLISDVVISIAYIPFDSFIYLPFHSSLCCFFYVLENVYNTCFLVLIYQFYQF